MVAAYTGNDNEESVRMLEQIIARGGNLDEQTLTNGTYMDIE